MRDSLLRVIDDLKTKRSQAVDSVFLESETTMELFDAYTYAIKEIQKVVDDGKS